MALRNYFQRSKITLTRLRNDVGRGYFQSKGAVSCRSKTNSRKAEELIEQAKGELEDKAQDLLDDAKQQLNDEVDNLKNQAS
jgi:hypothetical protein